MCVVGCAPSADAWVDVWRSALPPGVGWRASERMYSAPSGRSPRNSMRGLLQIRH